MAASTQPSSPPAKPGISSAKLCSVILVFLAMLTAASVPLQGQWLWLMLPLAFLLYLDVTSGAGSALGALLAPQLWVFYGGLVIVAVAFEFGGLKPARTEVAAPTKGINMMPPLMPVAASSRYPTQPNYPTTRPSAPGSTTRPPTANTFPTRTAMPPTTSSGVPNIRPAGGPQPSTGVSTKPPRQAIPPAPPSGNTGTPRPSPSQATPPTSSTPGTSPTTQPK